MALEYSYRSDVELVTIEGRGNVTMDDRAIFVQRIMNDLCLPEKASVLINVTSVTNPPSTEEARQIGVLVEKLLARFGRRLAIVNVTLVDLCFSHMVKLSVAEGYDRLRVFNRLGDALAFLDLA